MPIPGFRVRPLNGGCVCGSVSKETDKNMQFGPSTTAPPPHWGLRNASNNELMHNIILKSTKRPLNK